METHLRTYASVELDRRDGGSNINYVRIIISLIKLVYHSDNHFDFDNVYRIEFRWANYLPNAFHPLNIITTYTPSSLPLTDRPQRSVNDIFGRYPVADQSAYTHWW